MSDTPVFRPDDDVDEIEALLRELDADDLEITPPPADVWDAVEAAVRHDATSPPTGNVVTLASRSRFRVALLSAAAAVALIAVGAVVVSSTRGDDATVATATLVHEADFDPLGADAAATAQLVERDGGFRIELDDADLPDPGDNDLELWLIAAADDGTLDVQPVALVDASAPGVYDVPAGLDPDVYSIVDISIEPRDGDETHSGRSILRGALTDV